MHNLYRYSLAPFLLVGHALAQNCIKCMPDKCVIGLVPETSLMPTAKSVCESWLSVTVTPTLMVTSTVYVDPTSTTTVTVPTTAVTTRTTSLVKARIEQQRRQQSQTVPFPPGLSTTPGVVVPASVPSPYSGICDDAKSFLSACVCIGAQATTVTGSTVTMTNTVTTTSGVAVSTSIASASTTDYGTPSTPTGFLVVQPSGGPVDSQYLVARNVSQGSSVAIPILFTQIRSEATIFDIDTGSAVLEGYGPTYQGTQMVSGGENAPQSDGNVYNAMFLLPREYSQTAQLPVPHCSTSGRSGMLDCVELVSDDTRHILQYCPPRSDWEQPFNTYGFLVLDFTVNPNCTAISLKFQNTS